MKRLNFKAILLGVLTDLVASFLLALVAGFVIAVTLITKGTPPSAIPARLLSDPNLFLFSLVGGLLAEALGGFVAGKLARADHALHGAIVGAIGVILSWLFDSKTYPMWFTVASLLLIIPAAVGGALLAKPKSST